MIRALLGINPAWIALAAAVATVCGAIWWYGHTRYAAGVRDTTAAFVAADKEGAKTVHETASETLAGIGDDTDPDELLRDTDGFRD